MNGYRFPKKKGEYGSDYAIAPLATIEELIVGEARGGARVGFADGHVSLTLPSRMYEEGPQPIAPSQARVLAALLVAGAEEAERQAREPQREPICPQCMGAGSVNGGLGVMVSCPTCGVTGGGGR